MHLNMQEAGFLVQTCGLCNKEMPLVEGDIIFGDKWFHKDCWKLNNEESKQ